MRLHIKTKDFRLHLILPTALVLNRLTFSIGLLALRSRLSLQPGARHELYRQLCQLRRLCRHNTLVEIRTHDGEEILLRF